MFSAGQAFGKRKVALSSLAMLPLLTACAVQTPPEILNSTGGAAGTRDIALLLPTDDESALRVSFRDNLKAAFKDHAIAYDEEANVIGDFAISTMPANVELASTAVEASSASSNETPDETIVTQSAARKSLLLDKCEAVRFRASLALFERKSGERIHRAESEAFGCKSNQAPLRRLAKALVGNAVLSPR